MMAIDKNKPFFIYIVVATGAILSGCYEVNPLAQDETATVRESPSDTTPNSGTAIDSDTRGVTDPYTGMDTETFNSWEDRNHPPTFGDRCDDDPEVCEAPFTCLFYDEWQVYFCSMRCETTSDCPSWVATGHCAGEFQSSCDESGVCLPMMCV